MLPWLPSPETSILNIKMKLRVHICNGHKKAVLNITTGVQGVYLADSMPVSGQFYGFDILSGDLDLGPRSKLHFPSNAQIIRVL